MWQLGLRPKLTEMEAEMGGTVKPFESPYYWAAFCAIGQGVQQMSACVPLIQAFIDLVEKEPGLFSAHWDELREIARNLPPSDEEILKVLENWLKSPSRLEIGKRYGSQLAATLSTSKEKGLANSECRTPPDRQSKPASELLSNAILGAYEKNSQPPTPPAKP